MRYLTVNLFSFLLSPLTFLDVSPYPLEEQKLTTFSALPLFPPTIHLLENLEKNSDGRLRPPLPLISHPSSPNPSLPFAPPRALTYPSSSYLSSDEHHPHFGRRSRPSFFPSLPFPVPVRRFHFLLPRIHPEKSLSCSPDIRPVRPPYTLPPS